MRVTVGAEGFEPRTIQAETGDSVALYLTRTTDATCAKEVSFFGRGVQVALPKDQEIKVTIDVDEPGVVKFGCLSGDEGAIIKVSANRRQ